MAGPSVMTEEHVQRHGSIKLHDVCTQQFRTAGALKCKVGVGAGLDHKETCRKYEGARLYHVWGLELLSHDQAWILEEFWWLSEEWTKGVKDGRAPHNEALLKRQY